MWELCPFWNLKYWKYTVFHSFLLHALTYWAELLYITLFFLHYKSSSNIVNLRKFLWELCPFWNLKYWKYTVFRTISYMLWHIELKFCIWLCFTVLQIKFECYQFASIFVGVMPLLELKILEIHSFPLFSLTCFDLLSWTFVYYFIFSALQIKFEHCQFA